MSGTAYHSEHQLELTTLHAQIKLSSDLQARAGSVEQHTQVAVASINKASLCSTTESITVSDLSISSPRQQLVESTHSTVSGVVVQWNSVQGTGSSAQSPTGLWPYCERS